MTISANSAVAIQCHADILQRDERPDAAAVPRDVTIHVTGTAPLRHAALQADGGATLQQNLALLWWELTRGVCQVIDGFFTESRCLLLTTVQTPPRPIEGRRLKIVEAVLCGVGQKNIAMELGLAPSTIALNARLGLEAMGVHSKPSRAHPLLMLTALAGHAQDSSTTARLSYLTLNGQMVRVVSVVRPDSRLRSVPPAELAVVRSLIEGTSYGEIARTRGTSTRTIANQITAVFRRLKVSGRNELLARLFVECNERGSPSGLVMTAVTSKARVWDAPAP